VTCNLQSVISAAEKVNKRSKCYTKFSMQEACHVWF